MKYALTAVALLVFAGFSFAECNGGGNPGNPDQPQPILSRQVRIVETSGRVVYVQQQQAAPRVLYVPVQQQQAPQIVYVQSAPPAPVILAAPRQREVIVQRGLLGRVRSVTYRDR